MENNEKKKNETPEEFKLQIPWGWIAFFALLFVLILFSCIMIMIL